MGRKTFAVSWIWMAMAFAYFVSISTQLNATHQSYTKYGYESNLTLPADSELSGSERIRRLIPYMAFYLPPSALPVNQEYSIKTPQQNRYSSNSSEHQQPPTAIESAGPLPPPGYIAVPSYYFPSGVENSNKENGNSEPIVHLLPPAAAAEQMDERPYVGVLVRERPPKRQKTVQHFPPLYQDTVQNLQEESHQQQAQGKQIWFPQRLKASKINFTPFTPTNTLPGKFVPVFYSSSTGNGGKSKTINYHYDETAEEPMHQMQLQQQEEQQQQNYESAYKEQQQTHHHHQMIAESIPLPLPPDETSSAKDAQQEPHIDFIAIGGLTGPSAESVPSTQSGPAYHIVKDNSPPTAFSPISPHQSLNSLKAPQQLQYRPSKHPHYRTQRPDSAFPNEQRQPQHEARHQHAEHPTQQQYFNVNELTPQEKYVLYLRQRLRYNNKQIQKQKLYLQTSLKDTKQYSAPEYEQLQLQQQQQQQPPYSQANAEIPVDSDSVQLQQQPPQQEGYHRHSPLPHAVYLRPQLIVPSNHQPTPKSSTKPYQHVLQLPVQTLLSEIDSLPRRHQNKVMQPHRFRAKQQSKYIDSYGNPNPHYIDHEDPKQALEEQYPQNIPNQQVDTNSIAQPPPPSYIILTTSKPPYLEDVPVQQQTYPHHHAATQRPIYQHPPTLRLQPITAEDAKYAYVTKRPTQLLSPATPATIKHITKQYKIKYVPTTPTYHQMIPTPFTSTKLRPAMEYEENVFNRPPIRQQQATPPALPENYALEDPNQLPDIHTSSLADILHKLQASNHLPETLTAENIDNSIKTLITILNNLKKNKKIVPNPPQHHEPPTVPSDYDYSNGQNDHQDEEHDLSSLPAPPASVGPIVDKHPGPSTGRAGIDYPIYSEIPQTSFKCSTQRYKGFFGDPETNCQVWHYCDLNGGKASFLCPNGTIFSQIALTCDWWFNVKCSATAQLYVLNERLYKYILPFNPKFPEDYSGPLVDKYLAMKFQEMEEKMRLEKEKSEVKTVQEENHIEETTPLTQGSSIATVQYEKPHQKISEQSSERNLLTDDIPADIAQKGSFDTYESSTKQTATTKEYEETTAAADSFALHPIVVTSSTIEPEHSDEITSTSEEQEATNIADDQDETSERLNIQRSPSVQRERNGKNKIKHQKRKEDSESKVDVEKVEVIEIKSGKSLGQLTPDVFFAGSDTT